MKGQFFIISTVIIVYALVIIIQYIYDYNKVDLTILEEAHELDYIGAIKESLNRTADISLTNGGCNKVEADLIEVENFIKNELAKQMIDIEFSHDKTNCPTILFSFNITTSNMFSETKFKH